MDRPEWLTLCMAIVKPWEGLHDKRKDGLVYPYLDKLAKPPVWTRGYGRTYGITQDSPPITIDDADTELAAGLQAYGAKVLAACPTLAQYPACHAACVSWAWNCGTGAFARSRLSRAINEGRWADASQLILKPDTAGGVVYRGLQRRRAAEGALFGRGMPK